MTKRKLRKNAEINPPQSPHDGIHTCSKGCSKPGCTRTLRDTIEEQAKQSEALKRDVLEQAAAVRQLRLERVHDLNQIGGLQQENARLKAEVDRLTAFTTRTIIPNEELQAQVERLTKAGDILYKSMLEIGCNEMADNFQHDAWYGSIKDWNAAKEGKGQP